MPKLKLKSDFSEVYDCWFDNDTDEIFYRMSTEGMNRLEMLQFMEAKGLNVPAYGKVKDQKCSKLVVYTDLQAHCGEGKLLLDIEEALKEYPEHLSTEYIGECPGVSWRYLQIGKHCFWIEYKSNYDWRSNVGDLTTMQIIGHGKANRKLFDAPLLAVDFVIGKELYAIDYNIAPGIRWTGVEQFLSHKQIVEAIKEAYFDG